MSKVMAKDEANSNLNAVIDYSPKKLQARKVVSPNSSKEKKSFSSLAHATVSSFKMNPLLADRLGASKEGEEKLRQRVEELALEKLKEIQEKAYSEAYEVGLKEAKEEAYIQYEEEIKNRLESMDNILGTISGLMKELVKVNESKIVEIIYHLASKLAIFEIDRNEDRIIGVLKEVMKSLEVDGEVSIRVSSTDFDRVKDLIESKESEFSHLKKARVSPSDEIKPGGCVVDSNFGIIDASVEERINKLWDVLSSSFKG